MLKEMRSLTKIVGMLVLTVIAVLGARSVVADRTAEFNLHVRDGTVTGGQGFMLSVTDAAPEGEYSVKFGGREYLLYRENDKVLSIFLPVCFESEGKHELAVRHIMPDGRLIERKAVVNVTARDIKTVRISEEGMQVRRLQPGIQEEQEKVLAAIRLRTPERLWEEPFVLPMRGRVSAEFAQRRQRGDYVTYHRGVDLAARTGTPVKAINCGLVAFSASDFNIYGNLVVLDHGHGVTSCYFHMDRVLCETGGHVRRGEVIGEVGQTGWASGPHLHWGVYLQGTAVDPHWWVEFINALP